MQGADALGLGSRELRVPTRLGGKAGALSMVGEQGRVGLAAVDQNCQDALVQRRATRRRDRVLDRLPASARAGTQESHHR